MKVKQFLVKFDGFLHSQRGLSKGTIKQYHGAWTRLDRFQPDLDMTEVTIHVLDDFVASPLISRLAASTRANIITGLCQGLDYAHTRGIVASSPAVHLARPSRKRLYPRPLSPDDQERVERYIHGSDPSRPLYLDLRDRTLAALYYYAGARRAEPCVMTWDDDVDFEHKEIHLRKCKGGEFRTVPMVPELENQLRSYRAVCQGRCYVFEQDKGGELDAEAITITFVRHVQPATSPNVTPHTLRHTFATKLLRATRNLRVVQEALGHEDISSTAIYTHTDAQDMQEAFKELSYRRRGDRRATAPGRSP